MKCVINRKKYGEDHILWLLYLTIPYKDHTDFHLAKKELDSGQFDTICSFVNATTHPYDTWFFDQENKLEKFISNDVYRRQDKPIALEHHHYVCAFRANVIQNLNSELISKSTRPFVINNHKRESLIEVDSEDDFRVWQKIKAKDIIFK